jgi:dTDP-4-dehydrorhamnose reductase
VNPILVTGWPGELAQCINQVGCDWSAFEAWTHDLHFFDRASLDITNPKQVAQRLDEVKPAAVINCAALSLAETQVRQGEGLDINGYAPGRLARACASRNIPLVHISTDCVFGGIGGDVPGPWTERDDDETPVNWYGYTKRLGERLASQHWTGWMVIRTTALFSPCKETFLHARLRQAERGESHRVVSDRITTPTDARELARAILIATEKLIKDRNEYTGIYHFAGPECLSFADWTRMILEEAGLDTPIEPISSDETGESFKRPKNACLDSTKFAETFGYRHRPLRDCVREVVNAARVNTPA